MRIDALRYVPVSLVAIAVSFGTIIVLTRLLSAGEFGTYALVIVSINFAHMSLFTWLEASMARFRERASVAGEIDEHMATLLAGSVATLAIIVAVFAALLMWSPLGASVKTLGGFALAAMSAQLLAGLIEEGEKAARRIWRYSAIRVARQGVGLAAGIVLITVTPLREAGAIAGLALGASLVVLFESPKLVAYIRNGRISVDRLGTYFRYGAPLGATLVLAYLLEVGDLYLIGLFMGEAGVGIYNAGYGLANNSVDYLFTWLAAASMPMAIAAMERNGTDKAKQTLADLGETLLLISLPAAVGLGLVADEVGLLLGDPVRAGATALIPWVAIAAVLNGLVNLYVFQAFVLSERVGTMSVLMIGPVILNVGMNVWLIPIFGLGGAIASTLLAYSAALVVTTVSARRRFPLPLLGRAWLRCGAATAGMAMIVMAMPLDLVVSDIGRFTAKVGVGLVSYAVLAFILDAGGVRTMGLTSLGLTIRPTTGS